MGYTTLVTFEDLVMKDIYFLQVDRNTVLFSDGVNGLWAYSGADTIDNEAPDYAGRVRDYTPFLPDNNEGEGIAASSCPFAPSGKFLTLHKGRVFMANAVTSTVYYSGTRTDYVRVAGEGDPPEWTVPPVLIRPWELWNVNLDLSRANVGHGASMMIGNQNESIRGLADSEEGLWIFKDNQILLWTWPDSAAPHEVTLGAAVQTVASNAGLVSYRSLVDDRGAIVFLGQVENGEYKIFSLVNGQVNIITTLVDAVMDKIVNPRNSIGALHGDYYILFADIGEGVRPYIAVNMITGAVVEYSGPVVNAAVTNDSYGKIILGSGDTMLQYPGAYNVDSGGTEWELVTHRLDSGKPFHENKFRKFWMGIDTLHSDHTTIAVSQEDALIAETVNIELEYDNDSESYERIISGRDDAIVNMSKRSNGITAKVSGTATGHIRVNNMGIAVRDRRDKR